MVGVRVLAVLIHAEQMPLMVGESVPAVLIYSEHIPLTLWGGTFQPPGCGVLGIKGYS